jgi:hypothetical protein
MIGEVPEECGLADAWLAGYFDRKAGVECGKSPGQLDPAIEQTSKQLRSEEDWRRPGTNVRAFSPGSLTDDNAARVADLQNVSANRYLRDDRRVHRSFLNRLFGRAIATEEALIKPMGASAGHCR